jgi:Nuclease-related domain
MQVAGGATSRSAGQHARASVVRLRLRTLATLGVLAVATALLGRAFGLHDVRFLASEIALLTCMFAVSRYVLPLVDRRDRGATAEEHVGGLLEALPADEWRVIHDASFGHGNIDHILIGPSGVFTVETKSHPGPVRVGRVHGATIRQAQAQRDAIERTTGMRVEPLLVFSRAWVDRPLARRKGVRVLPGRMLVKHLTQGERHLSREQVGAVSEQLAEALHTQARAERVMRMKRRRMRADGVDDGE